MSIPVDLTMRNGFSVSILLHGEAVGFQIIVCHAVICIIRYEAFDYFQKNGELTIRNKIHHFNNLRFYGHINEVFSLGVGLNMRRTLDVEKNMSILIEVQDAQTGKTAHTFVVTATK